MEMRRESETKKKFFKTIDCRTAEEKALDKKLLSIPDLESLRPSMEDLLKVSHRRVYINKCDREPVMFLLPKRLKKAFKTTMAHEKIFMNTLFNEFVEFIVKLYRRPVIT